MFVDLSKPVEIKPNIYWIGSVDENTSLHCNPYLMIEGDEAVLFDPGSTLHLAATLNKLLMITDLEKIKYVVVTHQDPDLCGAIPELERMGGKFQIATHAKAAVLIKHYGVKSKFYLVSRTLNDRKLTLDSGRVLKFYPAWFCHFPGAFVTYDHTSKVLFSGDLFGGLSTVWSLFANETYVHAMNAFHENYMPSNQILNLVLSQLDDLAIDIIAPQHGSIINNNVDYHIDALRSLQCGVDFLMSPPDQAEKLKSSEGGYTEIVEAVIKRERSVLGDGKIASVLKKVAIEVDSKWKMVGDEYSFGDLERLMKALVDEFGPITIMYCRMKVQKIAQAKNLRLPKMLQ